MLSERLVIVKHSHKTSYFELELLCLKLKEGCQRLDHLDEAEELVRIPSGHVSSKKT